MNISQWCDFNYSLLGSYLTKGRTSTVGLESFSAYQVVLCAQVIRTVVL